MFDNEKHIKKEKQGFIILWLTVKSECFLAWNADDMMFAIYLYDYAVWI